MLTRHERLRWAWSLGALFAISGFGLSSWLGRIPAIRDSLHASTAQMSILALCIAAGSLTGFACAGKILGRMGMKRSLLLWIVWQALCLGSAALLLTTGTLAPYLVPVVLFCYGLGFGIHDVAINVTGGEAERQIRNGLMPLLHAAFSLGALLALVIGSATERIGISVQVHLVSVAGVMIIGAFVANRGIPKLVDAATQADETAAAEALTEAKAEGKQQHRSPWRDKRILLLGLVAASISLAEGTANDWLPLSLVDNHDFMPSGAALTLSVYFAAMTCARLLGGAALRRFGRLHSVRFTSVCCALGIILLTVSHDPVLAIVGIVLWGIGSSLGYPVSLSAAADNPATATSHVAAVAAIAYGSMLLGPVLIGFLGGAVTLRYAFLAVLVAVVLGIFATPALKERRE